MIENFDKLFTPTRPAFTQQRTFERARVLALSALVGLGRKTISGIRQDAFHFFGGFLSI